MENVSEIITSPSAIDSPSVQELFDQKEYYRYDICGQRNYVWERKRKTELICALLRNVKPSIITANINGKTIEVIDGQQRLNTIFSFINNEFKLSEDTKVILLIGGELKQYDLSNLSYQELPQEIKLLLLSRNIRIEKYMDLTDAQANYIMICLNNGKAHTNIERTRMENFGSIGNYVEDLKNIDLFVRKVNIRNESKQKLAIDGLIYSVIALETGISEDISITNYLTISERIRKENLLTDDIKTDIRQTFEYMNSTFPAKTKFLDIKNFIPIYLVCRSVRSELIGRELFNRLENFFSTKQTEYVTGEVLRWTNKEIIKKKYDVLHKYVIENVDKKLA